LKSKNRHFLLNISDHPLVSLFSALSGLCLAILIYIYHFQIPLFSNSRILMCVLIALVTTVIVDIFLSKITLPIFRSKSSGLRAAILTITVLAGILLSFSFSYAIPHIYPLYPEHTLHVNLDLRDLPADMDGLSFSHLQLAFRDVSFSELDLQGKYQVNEDDIFFPAGQSAGFTWQGVTRRRSRYLFSIHRCILPHYDNLGWTSPECRSGFHI